MRQFSPLKTGWGPVKTETTNSEARFLRLEWNVVARNEVYRCSHEHARPGRACGFEYRFGRGCHISSSVHSNGLHGTNHFLHDNSRSGVDIPSSYACRKFAGDPKRKR